VAAGSTSEASGSSSGDAATEGVDPLPATTFELEELGQEGGGFLDEPEAGYENLGACAIPA
jgi:hypothetical protein